MKIKKLENKMNLFDLSIRVDHLEKQKYLSRLKWRINIVADPYKNKKQKIYIHYTLNKYMYDKYNENNTFTYMDFMSYIYKMREWICYYMNTPPLIKIPDIHNIEDKSGFNIKDLSPSTYNCSIDNDFYKFLLHPTHIDYINIKSFLTYININYL